MGQAARNKWIHRVERYVYATNSKSNKGQTSYKRMLEMLFGEHRLFRRYLTQIRGY